MVAFDVSRHTCEDARLLFGGRRFRLGSGGIKGRFFSLAGQGSAPLVPVDIARVYRYFLRVFHFLWKLLLLLLLC